MSDLPLAVFVHLGAHLPRWLPHALRSLDSNTVLDTVVITDDPAVTKALQKRGHNVWQASVSAHAGAALLGNADRLHFRRGFWLNTTRRFWALEAFQKSQDVPVVHLESDVVTFPNFPVDRLAGLPQPIAYPLVGPGYAVASVFVSQQHEALTELLNVLDPDPNILARFGNPSLPNDMTLLGSVPYRHPKLVTPLPTVAPGINSIDCLDDQTQNLMGVNFEHFSGIFDGLAVGQYLAGVDPRNHWGYRYVYVERAHHSLKPSRLDFLWDGRELLVLDRGSNQPLPIFNLHVHSKDKRMFSNERRATLLRKRTNRETKVPTREFDPRAAIASTPELWSRGKRKLRLLRRPR